MKWIPSPFYSDRIELTWRDLLWLALGRVLKDSGIVLKRGTISDKEGGR